MKRLMSVLLSFVIVLSSLSIDVKASTNGGDTKSNIDISIKCNDGLEFLETEQNLFGAWDKNTDYQCSQIISKCRFLEKYIDCENTIIENSENYYENLFMLNTEAIAYSADVNNTANELLDLQNYDGGFGLSKNYASDILDTEIALRALEDIGETEAMINAVRYVVSCQNKDGGFGYQPGVASSAELSAEIANILADCVDDVQYLKNEIYENIVKLRTYLDKNAVALDDLNSIELGKVYQHFNTALFKLKMDKEYDVTSYYDLQAEDGGVYDDPLATALFLELIVLEDNTIVADVSDITFTTDEGTKASVYNSNENVNIVVDSSFNSEEGTFKVEIVKPNGDVVEMDTDNLVYDTADNDEGSYTVNAYVINKKNNDIAAKNTNVFTINRTFVAEGLDIWFGDGRYYIGDDYYQQNDHYGEKITTAHKGDYAVGILNANVSLKNLEEAEDDIVISWSLTKKAEDVAYGKLTIRRNSSGKYEYVNELVPCSLLSDSYEDDFDWNDGGIEFDEDVDISTFDYNFDFAHITLDTLESCTYVFQTDISLGNEVLKSALTTFIVSGQDMSILANPDKSELIAPEDEANISINLREKKTVDLVLANGSENVALSNEYVEKINNIKKALEDLGYSVNFGATKSTQYTAQDTFAWQEYDHIDYVESNKRYQEYNRHKHIEYEGDNIRMIGYCVEPMKDFLFVEGEPATKKVLEFDIEREDDDDWHTLDGAGFLFNTSIEDGYIEGNIVYIDDTGLHLEKLNRIELDKFRNGGCNYLYEACGYRRYQVGIDIGDVDAKHHLKVIVDGIYADVYVDDKLVINSRYIGYGEGSGYGPITSFGKHSCRQISSFRFSNISMKSIGGQSLENILYGYQYESYDSRYIINLSDKYDEDLNNPDNVENLVCAADSSRVNILTVGNDNNKQQYDNFYTKSYHYEDSYDDEVIEWGYGPVEGKFFEINDETTLDQLEEYIISQEESKYVINKEGNKATNLVFTATLYDGSTFTKTFDEMYEGEQLNFNINELMGDLVVGTDAPLLRDIKLTFKDALGDTCTATAPDMYLPVKAYTDSFTNKLTTDADEYIQYSNAILNNRIYNDSKKRTGKHLVSVINVKNAEGNVIKTYSKELNEIMVSSNVDNTEIWNIEDSMPGEYIVEAAIYDGNYLVSKDEKIITVKAYPADYIELDGSISLSQKLLKNADTLNITKYVKNTGINVVKDAKEVIRIVKVTDGVDSETLYSEEISLNLGRGEELETQVSIIPNVDLTDFSNGEYYIFHEVVLEDGTILQLEGDGFVLETEEKIELDKIFGDGALVSLNTDDSVNGIELNGAIITVGGTMHSNTNIVGNTSILNITNLYESVLPNTFNAMVTNITNESRVCGVIDTPTIDVPLDEKDIVIESPIYDNYTDKGSLLASEGDITIRSSYARFKGLIYAPNGTVTIESATFNMEGRIIAKNIIYKGSVLTVNTYDGDLDLLK